MDPGRRQGDGSSSMNARGSSNGRAGASSYPTAGPAAAEPLFSPALSEVGSVTSSAGPVGGSDGMRRLGTLQGAGLSALNLALNNDAGFQASSSLVGFNAISTLLNNPNKPQRPIDPNSSRYPAISQSHTDLPKVKKADYEKTIQSVRAEWDRFQRSQKLGIRGKARLDDEDDPANVRDDRDRDDDADDDDQLHGRLSLDESEAPTRALGKKRLPPLSTVPQVFFAEDFDLGNPYTFDLVTERYKAASSSPSSSRKGSVVAGYDVALNQMLQEKLSYYSDVVEQHLILEISMRSSSFFAALGNLKDLEAESRMCLGKVEQLKRELDERDEGIAKAGLTLIREQAKRRETAERLEAVGFLNQLCEKRDLCSLLVQNNEWSDALDVMQDLEDIIEGKTKLVARTLPIGGQGLQPYVDMDLSSIAAVQALAPQLQEMRKNIAAQLEVELLSVLVADAEERAASGRQESGKVEDIEQSINAIQANQEEINADGTPNVVSGSEKEDSAASDKQSLSPVEEQLAHRIKDHVLGLVRTNGIDRTVTAYKEAMVKVARTTMRTYLKEASLPGNADLDIASRSNLATLLEDDEAAQGRADAKLGAGGAEAANRLQKLSQPQFIALLTSILKGLEKCVESVSLQRRVLVKLLDDEGRRSSKEDAGTYEAEEKADDAIDLLMPPGVSPSLPAILMTIVSDVCASTHILVSRLLSLRSTAHVSLPLDQFLAVFHLVWTFILQSEATCGRMIIGLRGVVLNQAKSWLAIFHKTHIERAAKAVEEELWGQADVKAKQQGEVTLIIESATSDPNAFVIPKESIKNAVAQASTEQEHGQSEKGDGNNEDNSTSKTLVIEDKQYYVVSATLDVLDMLIDYVRVIINLPLLSTEIMGRVVEYLKQFNSRTCQVVLGAGAMRSAGLKNITAKHLALASQSLSIMIALIPYVRETVRRHLNPRQAVMLVEFDKLKRDYQEHQYEIHSKLVAIMSDRLTVHCRALVNVDWSAAFTDDEEAHLQPIKPMMDLVKETTTLHKVLCKYLQANVVESVIGQVLISIDKRIASEFDKVESRDGPTLKRAEAVRDYFNEKFGTLKHVNWNPDELTKALEELKKIPAPPAPKTSIDGQGPASPVVQSPVSPPVYKPRLSLFARKQQQLQQQQQQQQDVKAVPPLPSDQRESVDASSLTLASVEATDKPTENGTSADVEVTAPNDSLTEEVQAGAVEAEEAAAKVTPDKDQDGPAASNEIKDDAEQTSDPPISATLPPPTPSKEQEHAQDEHASVPAKTVDAASNAKEESSLGDDRQPPAESSTAVNSTPSAPVTPTKVDTRNVSNGETSMQSPPPSSGRLTLQQRLAEAARRRAQATGSRPNSRPSTAQNEEVSAQSSTGTDHPPATPSKDGQTGNARQSVSELDVVEETTAKSTNEETETAETAPSSDNVQAEDETTAQTGLAEAQENNTPEEHQSGMANDERSEAKDEGADEEENAEPVAPEPAAAVESVIGNETTEGSVLVEPLKTDDLVDTSDVPLEREELVGEGISESATLDDEGEVKDLPVVEGAEKRFEEEGEDQGEPEKSSAEEATDQSRTEEGEEKDTP